MYNVIFDKDSALLMVYIMEILLAANGSVFQCFSMRSRVAPRVFWDVRLEGFLAQSNSRSVQEGAGMKPVNRTLDTNKILELSACGILMQYITGVFSWSLLPLCTFRK